MYNVDKKSYVIIEASKEIEWLIPSIIVGLESIESNPIAIFSLKDENNEMFKEFCTPWSERDTIDIGGIFHFTKVRGTAKDLLAFIRNCEQSFSKGATIIVDDYHKLFENTSKASKKYVDFPQTLEEIAQNYNESLIIFSDSTSCNMCPICNIV